MEQRESPTAPRHQAGVGGPGRHDGVLRGEAQEKPRETRAGIEKDEYGLRLDVATVYGVLSLIVWSLLLIVSVKYIVFIMRLDNHGEGGENSPPRR